MDRVAALAMVKDAVGNVGLLQRLAEGGVCFNADLLETKPELTRVHDGSSGQPQRLVGDNAVCRPT
ncbi:MAG TPA: hypothetical protein VM580_32145 [Labilithrix sp.]|nr:hypothetical protein [Labilithrix sp.]